VKSLPLGEHLAMLRARPSVTSLQRIRGEPWRFRFRPALSTRYLTPRSWVYAEGLVSHPATSCPESAERTGAILGLHRVSNRWRAHGTRPTCELLPTLDGRAPIPRSRTLARNCVTTPLAGWPGTANAHSPTLPGVSLARQKSCAWTSQLRGCCWQLQCVGRTQRDP